MSTIATMDNGTMVEALKYLNYCQLAKNSLVTKRFRNLIQSHRHSLALLYVHKIGMDLSKFGPAAIRIFGNELSPDAYNEWIMRNNYSKQVPTESQIASEESTQSITYGFAALYQDSSHRGYYTTPPVFSARVKHNDENWPIFQHFVRLAADPFIFIDRVRLIYQNDILNALAGAIISNYDRLQCERLEFDFEGNSQKSITWIKNNMRCNKLYIYGGGDLNEDETFLDFFMTGANCTSSIGISDRDLSKAVTDLVKKFINLKNSNESQLVETIDGTLEGEVVELFYRDYAEFIVKEETHRHITKQVFEFVNNGIGKKLQLTIDDYDCFTIKINNL